MVVVAVDRLDDAIGLARLFMGGHAGQYIYAAGAGAVEISPNRPTAADVYVYVEAGGVACGWKRVDGQWQHSPIETPKCPTVA
jgi:hypothetical protein